VYNFFFLLFLQSDELPLLKYRLCDESSLEPRQATPMKSRKKYSPRSVVDAQFSMPFGAAVAILYRKAGLGEFHLSKIRSEEAKRMMRRVECVIDPDLDRTFPKQWCATAEVFTKDGKRYFTKIEYCKGDPENLLSWEELIEKFHDLSNRFWAKERRVKIVEQVRNFEKIRDLREWSSLLLRNR